MKTYYIPTSTLNFNNILSSESISPKAFYEKRGFGYSRWTAIPENGFNHAIILYEKPGLFNRPKGELEDHPMIIEVVMNETMVQKRAGFSFCDQTIYFTPTTTRFLFFSDLDKRITLSMTENSLETKLLHLYAKRIAVVSNIQSTYIPIIEEEPCHLNENELRKDLLTNKMKGLLYGYYIGALLSTDISFIRQLKVLREIHDIFASINSSIDKQATQTQINRLKELFLIENQNSRLFQKIIAIIKDPSQTIKILDVVKSEYGHLRDYEDLDHYLYQLQTKIGKDDIPNPAITWIKTKIDGVRSQMELQQNLLSPLSKEIVVENLNLTALNSKEITDTRELNLYYSWVNETLSDKNINGKISSYREELAKNLTLKAKDVYKDSWEGSHTRTILNDLRRHIAGDAFNHNWNNGLLSSIASVILAGNDWDKLLSFMQNKEMTDYRIAFSLFGAINGYANLTRDFTDILYEQPRKEYVWSVYEEIYHQLYGESIGIQGLPHIQTTNTLATTNNTIASLCNKPIQQTAVTEIIKTITKQPKFDSKKHQKYITKIQEQSITDWLEIRQLNGNKKDGWRKMIDDAKTATKEIRNPEQASLFPIENNYSFKNDINAWNHIEKLIPSDSRTNSHGKTKRELIKEDLEWFQKERATGDNKKDIELFCDKFKTGFDKYGNEQGKYYTKELRESMKRAFLSYYCKNG